MSRAFRPCAVVLCVGWALGVSALSGCGAPPAVVKGTVTVDGAPADDGSVNFEPADGQGASAGAKVTNGTYEVPASVQMAPGKKKVTIRTSLKTGRQVPAAPPAPPGTIVDELRFHPPVGVQPDVQEVEVKAGENDISFTLTSKPSPKKK